MIVQDRARSKSVEAGPAASAAGSGGANGHAEPCLPFTDLIAMPAPDGVDTTRREAHLSPGDFYELFRMDIESFYAQPKWKRIQQRKTAGLF